MKILNCIVVFCLVMSVSGPAGAAAMIESFEEGAGSVQKTWVDGARLRVETGDENQYMLMNFTGRTMYLVNHERGSVLDMSGIAAELAGGGKSDFTRPEYTVNNMGAGPDIAGHPTEHYVVSFKGNGCLEAFTSRRAVQELGLQEFIAGMNEMFPQTGTHVPDDPCQFAEAALDYGKIGVPLRLLRNGEERYRVLRLEKNAPVPAGGFMVPEGYVLIDYSRMVREMKQGE